MSTAVDGAVRTLNAAAAAGCRDRSTDKTRSAGPKLACTASIAGYCSMRHAVQLGVEKTISDGRPSGAAPSVVQSPSAGVVRNLAVPRWDHQRTAMTVAAMATATMARTKARSTIESDPTKDAAPVQLGDDEAQGAEVEAGVQRDHDGNRKGEDPGQDGVAGQQ